MDFVVQKKSLLVSLALVALSCFSGCSSSVQQGFPGAGGSGATSSTAGANSQGGSQFGFATGGSLNSGTGTNACKADGGPCYKVVDAGPYCGDGIIQPDLGETCDDGNRIGGDGCSGICKIEPNWICSTPGQPCTSTIICGNGVRQTGEGCDDGNTTPGDGCDASCNVESGWYCAGSDPNDPSSKSQCQKLASCGDGRIQTGESCDLGAANGTNVGCDANCKTQDGYICRPLPTGCVKMSVCGNGKIEGSEECDDGNTDAGDGCSSACKIEASYFVCTTPGQLCTNTARCGDGILENAETCDVGTASSDGCVNCQVQPGYQCRMPGKACIPLCGDGQIIGTETCDDGKPPANGDGCSSTCQVEPGWSCTGTPSVCTQAVCGNGAVETGESCDKGTANGLFYGDGTGCSKTCTNEPKCRNAAGVTGPCTQTCGDGNVDTGEQCDDGNQVSGDGCSATCQTETGFTCTPTPQSDAQPCPSNPSLQCLVLPVTYRDFDGHNLFDGSPRLLLLRRARDRRAHDRRGPRRDRDNLCSEFGWDPGCLRGWGCLSELGRNGSLLGAGAKYPRRKWKARLRQRQLPLRVHRLGQHGGARYLPDWYLHRTMHTDCRSAEYWGLLGDQRGEPPFAH